ncbi:MAG TPA: pirin family protein, partial [Phnomibacter sp.]|nr:pirin family protein [Phnomibacter sp.]
ISIGYYEAGKTFSYHWPAINKCVFLFTISGKLIANGLEVAQRDAVGFWDTSSLEIQAVEESRFVLIEVPINH